MTGLDASYEGAHFAELPSLCGTEFIRWIEIVRKMRHTIEPPSTFTADAHRHRRHTKGAQASE